MFHDDVAPFGCVPTFFVVRMASHAQVQVRWVVGVVAWFCLAYCVVLGHIGGLLVVGMGPWTMGHSL